MWNLKTPTNQTKDLSSWKQRTDWWLPEVEVGTGEMGEGGQKVQISRYKVIKSWRCNVQHDDYS